MSTTDRPVLTQPIPHGITREAHGQHPETRTRRQAGLASPLPHPPAGRQRNKTFARKIDAERFPASIESAKNIGSSVGPALSEITIGEWAEIWLAGRAHLKECSRERYAGILREHIIPVWAKPPLANVGHADALRGFTQLSARRSAATTKMTHRVRSLILDLAVRDGRLSRNVAQKINLPRTVRASRAS